MNTVSPLRVLVVIGRPLASLVTLERGSQQFQAVSPVPLEPVEFVRDRLRQVFLDDRTPAHVRYLSGPACRTCSPRWPNPTTRCISWDTGRRTALSFWKRTTGLPET